MVTDFLAMLLVVGDPWTVMRFRASSASLSVSSS